MSNQSGVNITGSDVIIRNLESKVSSIKKVKSIALQAGAEIVQQELIKQSPYDAEEKIHMKEHVVKSGIRIDKETGADYIVIGYPNGIKHRVHVVEFGTINQAPQHFISDTVERTKTEVAVVIAQTLKEALK